MNNDITILELEARLAKLQMDVEAQRNVYRELLKLRTSKPQQTTNAGYQSQLDSVAIKFSQLRTKVAAVTEQLNILGRNKENE